MGSRQRYRDWIAHGPDKNPAGSRKPMKTVLFWSGRATSGRRFFGTTKILRGRGHVDFAGMPVQMAGVGTEWLRHSAPAQGDPVRDQRQEYFVLTNAIYSIERDSVDPVFFAVVPDTFMTQGSGGQPVELRRDVAEWSGDLGRPFVAPQDRWSF